jgi:hypothetical protein
VIGFRIDGHFIKRGALISNFGHLVRQVLIYMHLHLGLSDTSETKRKKDETTTNY